LLEVVCRARRENCFAISFLEKISISFFQPENPRKKQCEKISDGYELIYGWCRGKPWAVQNDSDYHSESVLVVSSSFPDRSDICAPRLPSRYMCIFEHFSTHRNSTGVCGSGFGNTVREENDKRIGIQELKRGREALPNLQNRIHKTVLT
jgi:hypothetical protein